MTTTPTFSPAAMPQFKAPAAPKTTPKPSALVRLDPIEPGTLVRPGTVEQVTVTSGVIKAKHVKPGMELRAFLKGEPRGAKRTVASKRRVPGTDGAKVEITWTEDSPLPHVSEYAAAYRFHGEAIEVVKHVPTLVPYSEV